MKALASINNFVLNKFFDWFSHLDARAHLKSVTDLVSQPVRRKLKIVNTNFTKWK